MRNFYTRENDNSFSWADIIMCDCDSFVTHYMINTSTYIHAMIQWNHLPWPLTLIIVHSRDNNAGQLFIQKKHGA